jgi:hypothetical protein
LVCRILLDCPSTHRLHRMKRLALCPPRNAPTRIIPIPERTHRHPTRPRMRDPCQPSILPIWQKRKRRRVKEIISIISTRHL